MSVQNDQTPAEKEIESSLVSGEEEESCASPAEYAWLASSEHDGAYGASCDEDEMLKPLDASREECALLPDEDDMLNPPAVFNQDDQAPNPPDKDMWNMCLRLYCDPSAQPYTCSDFKKALEKLGLGHEIAGIGPLTFGKVWLLKLKTTEAWQTLANARSIKVKGRYCAVADPRKHDILVEVQWVPFNLPDATIVKILQKYGAVSSVARQEWSPYRRTVDTTTRYVHLRLNEGVGVEDLPYLYSYSDQQQLHIVVQGRLPLCFKCGTEHRVRQACRNRRNERCDGTRAPPVKPGDVQVAPAGSEEHSGSSQETAPAAEEARA